MTTMRAVQIQGPSSNPKPTLTDTQPTPTPTGDELLIRVHAAGITYDELHWPETYAKPSRIPGHELSGTIAGLGPQYSGDLRLNDDVFAMMQAGAGAAHAEYATCAPGAVTLKPRNISHAQAGALPIPLLTALEAVEERARVHAGMRVLVAGASGAVGAVLVQVLRARGARVVALAAMERFARLRELGAAEVVDRSAEGWEAAIERVDVAFDTVGSGVLSRCWTAVKDDGMIVTIADPPPAWAFGGGLPQEARARPGVRYDFFILSASVRRLEAAREMVERGEVVPLDVVPVPFARAVEAWEVAGRKGRGGKVVLVMREEDGSV